MDNENNASIDTSPLKPIPGWRWYLFGRDTIDGEEVALMTVSGVPPRVAAPWRQHLTKLLMGSEWEWIE